VRPYKFRMEKVGEFGNVGKFYGPGLEAGKAVIGAEDLNTAYREGRKLAARWIKRHYGLPVVFGK
jgi:hypothetical protein